MLFKLYKWYSIQICRNNDSWGYHGNDGYFHYSEKKEWHGPLFTTGDTIGCCLNFINGTVFRSAETMTHGVIMVMMDIFIIQKRKNGMDHYLQPVIPLDAV